jgi:hypothetical protein
MTMWNENTVVYCRNGLRVGWIPEHYFQSITPGRLRDAIMHPEIEELIRLGYCTECGAESIPACESCEAVLGDPINRPAYCGSCGKPFPWTAIALAAAKEYTDELETLTDEDKVTLKESFADLTVDTARTPLAASRYKRIVSKLAPVAGETLQKIIVEVITNGAKKLMGGP